MLTKDQNISLLSGMKERHETSMLLAKSETALK
jgi:hypothetical protein